MKSSGLVFVVILSRFEYFLGKARPLGFIIGVYNACEDRMRLVLQLLLWAIPVNAQAKSRMYVRPGGKSVKRCTATVVRPGGPLPVLVIMYSHALMPLFFERVTETW